MNPMVLRPLAATLLLSLSLLSPGAMADESDLPEVKTQGQVSYLSGGIGSDETAAIKAASKTYALTLLFATTGGGERGAFLASVPVKITNAAGATVLDVTTEGPYLLANLAPGRYNVVATLDGVERKISVTLKSGAPQQKNLTWPQRAQDKVVAPVSAEAVATTSITLPTPAAPVAAAVESAVTPSAAAPAPAVPAQTQQGGVPYVSGGIGADESAALKAQFPKYAIALTFAKVQEGKNVFLASVPVKILDASGSTVLDVTTDGPYLLVDVPPGKYEVVATYEGKEQRAAVQVAAGKTSERAFAWKAL